MKFFNRNVKIIGKTLTAGNIVIDGTGDITTFKSKVFPMVNPVAVTPVTKTADYTITVAELDGIFDNTGDTGTMVLTLPAVSLAKGKALSVNILAAQIVRLLPVTGQSINLKGSAVVTKYLNIAGVIGNYVDLYCDGAQWIVTGYSGVVTKEA